MSKPVPQCESCALGTTRGRLVGTRGPADAPIVVVGRAPSEEEVNSGKPFSDGAGQCLDACMKRAGWGDTPVLYVNALRCRPPEGTKVSVDMLAHCGEALNYALTYRPRKLIVCLGNEAKAAVLGGTVSGVEKNAGLVRVHPVLGCPVVWTYMPLNVLYRPNLMHQFIGHLQKALCLYRDEDRVDPGSVAKKVLVRDVPALHKLVAYCRRRAAAGEPMAFDIETTGLDRFNDKIIGVAVGFVDFGAYVVLRHGRSHIEQQEVLYRGKPKIKDVEVWDLVDNGGVCCDEGMGLLKALLEDPDVPKVAHNSKFDVTFLRQECGINVRNLVGDSIIYQLLTDENSLLGLKFVSRQLYDAPDYEAAISEYYKKGKNLSMAPLAQVAEYACLDVIYTSLIARRLRYDVAQSGALGVHDYLLLPLSRELGEMELYGMRVDVPAVEEIGRRIEREMETLFQQVNDISGLGDTKLPCRAAKDKQIGVNPGSDSDMRYVLFEYFKLPITKYTDNMKKDKASVDNEVRKALLELPNVSPIARGVIEAYAAYKKAQKFHGTYVKNVLASVRSDGRIHASYGYNDKTEKSPATGRLSCGGGVNLQNQPKPFQPVFIPADGNVIVQPDHKAIEVRVWAAMSMDPDLIRFIGTPGVDFHREIGAVALGKKPDEVTDDERKISKVLCFGAILFMGGVPVAVKQLGCTEQEAQLFIDRINARFPKGAGWITRKVQEVHENHQVVTPLGRIRHLQDVTSAMRGVREQAERQGVNSPVQGTASDINCLCQIAMADEIRWHGLERPWMARDGETFWEWVQRRATYTREIEAEIYAPSFTPVLRTKIINTIHDALVFDTPEDERELIESLCHTVMTRRPYPEWPEELPLMVDVAVTKRWGADELDMDKISMSVAPNAEDEEDDEE